MVKKKSKFVRDLTITKPVAMVEAHEIARMLRVTPDTDLSAIDTSSTPGFSGGKLEGREALAGGMKELSNWQERLFAQSKADAKAAVLLVLQGMDTAGKGGIVRHVVGGVDPQGVHIKAFKAPTPKEKKEPFLSRIRRELPEPGMMGIFDRSHYEDVLIARVRSLVDDTTWKRRYSSIKNFERGLVTREIYPIKVMLHISADEQEGRLLDRLEDVEKHWKYRPGDVDERQLWEEYQAAYQDAVRKTDTDDAPWYVVPADRKWYARWAVQQLLLHHFRQISPQFPPADYDIDEEIRQVKASL